MDKGRRLQGFRVLGRQQDQIRRAVGPADGVDLVQAQMPTQGIEVGSYRRHAHIRFVSDRVGAAHATGIEVDHGRLLLQTAEDASQTCNTQTPGVGNHHHRRSLAVDFIVNLEVVEPRRKRAVLQAHRFAENRRLVSPAVVRILLALGTEHKEVALLRPLGVHHPWLGTTVAGVWKNHLRKVHDLQLTHRHRQIRREVLLG